MRIETCYNTSKCCLPAFKSHNVNKLHSSSNYCYTTTEFFRDDFDLEGFCYYMNKFYNKTPKVNVVCYGCSSGQETYSLNLKLKTEIKKQDRKKYYPIIAKDLDKNCIYKAKRGEYKISDEEAKKIDAETKQDLFRYIDIFSDGYEKYAYVKDPLKENILFSQADICEDIDNIPSKNTILICRNFLGYLPPEKQVMLAKKLGEKLDETSHVVIGSFDKVYKTDKLLEQNGFEETEIEGIFKKKAGVG